MKITISLPRIGKIIVFWFFTYSFIGTSVFAQNCNAELVVENNRNTRSANEDGAVFSLVLTNSSSITTTYNITTLNLEKSCANKNRGTSLSNVNLNIVIQGNTQISLSAGQSYSFKIQVSVPSGTPYYRWSCIEVQAKSDECNSISANILLKVYVPNPTEE